MGNLNDMYLKSIENKKEEMVKLDFDKMCKYIRTDRFVYIGEDELCKWCEEKLIEKAKEKYPENYKVKLMATEPNFPLFTLTESDWWKNRDDVYAAVSENGLAFTQAIICTQGLYRDDAELAFMGVKANGDIFKALSAELRDNKELAIEAVKIRPVVLMNASERLQKDEDVLRTAITSHRLHPAFFKSIEWFGNDEKTYNIALNAYLSIVENEHELTMVTSVFSNTEITSEENNRLIDEKNQEFERATEEYGFTPGGRG